MNQKDQLKTQTSCLRGMQKLEKRCDVVSEPKSDRHESTRRIVKQIGSSVHAIIY